MPKEVIKAAYHYPCLVSAIWKYPFVRFTTEIKDAELTFSTIFLDIQQREKLHSSLETKCSVIYMKSGVLTRPFDKNHKRGIIRFYHFDYT